MAEHRYDLVLTDAELPDGNGVKLANQAKEAGIKVLVVTGYALRLPADQLDHHEFVMKPRAACGRRRAPRASAVKLKRAPSSRPLSQRAVMAASLSPAPGRRKALRLSREAPASL